MADVQARLQQLSGEFQQYQNDLSNAIQSRAKLVAQKEENSNVQKEFENLGEGEIIYKMVGPVLVKQEKVEAEATVKGRLDFITGEIARSDSQIKEVEDKMDKIRADIVQIQAGAQQQQEQQSGPSAQQGKGKGVAA